MSTLDINPSAELSLLQRQLVARLAQVRRRVRLWLLIEGLAIVLAEAVVLGLFTFWADHTFRLGVAVRIGLVAVSAILLVVECVRRIVLPLFTPLGLVALAGAISRKSRSGEHADVAARVASVLELPSLLDAPIGVSAAMVDRAVRRRHEALAEMDFGAAMDHGRLRKMLLLLAMAGAIPVSLFCCFPQMANLWARRMFLASHEPWPQNTYLQIADERDGRIQVPHGEPYVLRASARDGSKAPQRVFLTIRGADKTNVLMKQFGENDFRHDFAVVDQPLRLEFQGGDDDYGPILLDPVDRPKIVGLVLEAQHPRQPAPERHDFNGGDADLSFLVKTRLSLRIEANVPLRELRLRPESKHPRPEDLHRIDATNYVLNWIQEGSSKFNLELVAEESGLLSLPVPVSIGLKVDSPPRITMSFSGVRQRITPQAHIPLVIDARDDYGLTAVGLTIKDETPDPVDPSKLVSHSEPQPIYPAPGPPPAGTSSAPKPASLPMELQLKQTMDAAREKLQPGSFISLTAAATDNCYTGEQTSHSRTVSFSIVSPEELFREILMRQQAERIKFRKATDEAQHLRDLIQSTIYAKQLGDFARRHRAVQLEVLRISTVLDEASVEIKLNGLGSPESQALMVRNVLTPLKILSEELIAPQTAAIEAVMPPPGGALDLAKLKPLADRQDQIVAQMQQIYKQMSQWDSFVDVLNQLEQIIKLETGVKDDSQKLKKKETEGLFDK